MIDSLLSGIASLVIGAVNALIAALGTVLAGLFSVLPDLPALPTLPPSFAMAEGWVAWVFPVSTVIDVLTYGLSVWVMWQVVALALRWAKFQRGGA